MKHYLQTARVHDYDRAGWRYAEHAFTQEQAAELLPVLEDYIRRIGGNGMSSVRDHLRTTAATPGDAFDAVLAAPTYNQAQFRRVFIEHEFSPAEARRLASPVASFASRVGWNDDLREVSSRLRRLATELKDGTTNNIATPTTRVLKVGRTIRPLFVDDRGESLPIDLGRWVEHNGKLIMIGSHPSIPFISPPVSDGPRAIELDPLTGGSRMMPQVISMDEYRFQIPKFQILEDELFWINGDSKLEVLGVRSGERRTHEVRLPLRQAELFPLAGRLFIADENYIAEFSLTDRSAHLLASKRRKPAVTQLDDWPGWSGKPSLWLDRHGTLFANVGGTNVWQCEAATCSWHEWTSNKGNEDLPWTFSFYPSSADCEDYRQWVDGSRQIVLSAMREKLPLWPMPYDYPLTPGKSLGNMGDHCFDGTNLWILWPATKLNSTPTILTTVPLTDRDMTLLWFDPRWENPAEIPLVFDREAKSAGAAVEEFKPGFGGLKCHALRDGLLLAEDRPDQRFGYGRWFIPWTQLHQWVARNQPTNSFLPRSEPERRRRFDLNHNGILDPEELHAMNADASWRKEDENFEARRFLLAFDANRDEKLDVGELRDLVTLANQGSFVQNPERIRPFVGTGRWEPNSLLQEFDRNNDHVIDINELPGVLRRIRFEGARRAGSGIGGMRTPR